MSQYSQQRQTCLKIQAAETYMSQYRQQRQICHKIGSRDRHVKDRKQRQICHKQARRDRHVKTGRNQRQTCRKSGSSGRYFTTRKRRAFDKTLKTEKHTTRQPAKADTSQGNQHRRHVTRQQAEKARHITRQPAEIHFIGQREKQTCYKTVSKDRQTISGDRDKVSSRSKHVTGQTAEAGMFPRQKHVKGPIYNRGLLHKSGTEHTVAIRADRL